MNGSSMQFNQCINSIECGFGESGKKIKVTAANKYKLKHSKTAPKAFLLFSIVPLQCEAEPTKKKCISIKTMREKDIRSENEQINGVKRNRKKKWIKVSV